MAAYIPNSACHVIHTTITDLQTQHPCALTVISGDFYHVPLTTITTLPHFTQYASCPTREERTLDFMYVNMKDAPPHPRQVRSQSYLSCTLLCASGQTGGGQRRLMGHCLTVLRLQAGRHSGSHMERTSMGSQSASQDTSTSA